MKNAYVRGCLEDPCGKRLPAASHRLRQNLPADPNGSADRGAAVLEKDRDSESRIGIAHEADEPGVRLLTFDFGSTRFTTDGEFGECCA